MEYLHLGQTYAKTAIPGECLWFWFYFPVAIAYRYRLCWCSSHEVINQSCYHSWLGVTVLQRKLTACWDCLCLHCLGHKRSQTQLHASRIIVGVYPETRKFKREPGIGNPDFVYFWCHDQCSYWMVPWVKLTTFTGYAREPAGKWSKAEGHDAFRLTMATTFLVAWISLMQTHTMIWCTMSRQMTLMSVQV